MKNTMKATKPPSPSQENEMVTRVVDTLDRWLDWVGDVQRGVLTPYQFLAVVLWWIATEKAGPDEDALIVNGWFGALAARRAGIRMLHPVTLLPLSKTHASDDWVLSIRDAQEFLDSMPIGFNLEKALAFMQKEAAELVVDGAATPTYEQAVAQRKAGSKSKWTDGQLAVVAARVAIDGAASVAKDIGIFRQTLEKTLQRATSSHGPAKAHDTYKQLRSA